MTNRSSPPWLAVLGVTGLIGAVARWCRERETCPERAPGRRLSLRGGCSVARAEFFWIVSEMVVGDDESQAGEVSDLAFLSG